MKPALDHVREAWPGARPGSAIVKYTEAVQADALEAAADKAVRAVAKKLSHRIRTLDDIRDVITKEGRIAIDAIKDAVCAMIPEVTDDG